MLKVSFYRLNGRPCPQCSAIYPVLICMLKVWAVRLSKPIELVRIPLFKWTQVHFRSGSILSQQSISYIIAHQIAEVSPRVCIQLHRSQQFVLTTLNVDICYRSIRRQLHHDRFLIDYIPSSENFVDALTKALTPAKYWHYLEIMGFEKVKEINWVSVIGDDEMVLGHEHLG